MDTKNIGLRNIEVADTKISYIDGHKESWFIVDMIF